ncbi:MAG: hypothetical protein HZA54_00130 [Planctomycetes bacterium]|nr:hypothetical protein [Planctomycetota bacterium]
MNAEKKRWLGVAGGSGAAVLLVLLAVLLPLRAAADGARRDADQRRKVLEGRMNGPEYHAEGDLARGQQELDRLEQGVADLARALALPADPTFARPDDSGDHLIAYKSTVEAVRRALRKAAADRDVAMPEGFGFPEGEVPASEAAALLRRLQTADRVLRAALDAGVQSVLTVAPRGDKEAKDADDEEAVLLARDPVTVEVMAPFEAVLSLLHAIQTKGSFLALEQLTLESADPEKNLLRARLTVAGLRVDVAAKVGPVEPSGAGGPKKPPATGWRPGR